MAKITKKSEMCFVVFSARVDQLLKSMDLVAIGLACAGLASPDHPSITRLWLEIAIDVGA